MAFSSRSAAFSAQYMIVVRKKAHVLRIDGAYVDFIASGERSDGWKGQLGTRQG